MSTAAPGGVQSLHRSLDLLEVIAARGGHLSLAELAAAVDIPAATAHRLLRTLVGRGYVRQLPDRRYALGVRLVPLGTATLALVSRTAQDALAALVAEVGETANLAVLSGHRAEYVAQAPSRYAMRMFTQVGRRVELHCTGVGKAMLAHLGDRVVDAVVVEAGLDRHTEHTLTTPQALRASLAQVRDRGWAVDEEERELGVRCVAVPVLEAGIPMAVSVSGPPTRLTDDVVGRAVPALREAAGLVVPGGSPPRLPPAVGQP